METKDKIALFRLEEKYLCFLAELKTEKKMLNHIYKCEACRKWVVDNMDGDEIYIDFGKLFDTIVYDPIVPKYVEFENLDNFIDARINWRLDRLDELIKNTEIELEKIELEEKEF